MQSQLLKCGIGIRIENNGSFWLVDGGGGGGCEGGAGVISDLNGANYRRTAGPFADLEQPPDPQQTNFNTRSLAEEVFIVQLYPYSTNNY
jgi:hypothetical protein